jgi:hypothetical protein
MSKEQYVESGCNGLSSSSPSTQFTGTSEMVSCVEEKKSQDEHYYKQLNPEAKHLNNISENSLNKDMEENFSTQTNLSKETVTNIGANSGLTTEQEVCFLSLLYVI